MADISLNIITSDSNTVSVTTDDRIVTITDNGTTTNVTIPQSDTSVVEITSTGAGGSVDNAVSASYALTASYALYAANGGGGGTGNGFPFSGSAVITGSLTVTGSTISTLGFTGSLQGTASWATNSVTASYAPSYVLNSATSSFVTNSQTGSFSTTGSNSFKSNQTITGSLIITGSATITGSLNVTQGITGSLQGTATTASYVTGSIFTSTNPALSASYALTASYAMNGGGGGATTLAGLTDVQISGQTNGQPLVYSTTATKWINSSALTASLFGTASWANNALTASTADAFTVRGNLIVSGNMTFGDATTDTITMNAATMSLGSGAGILNIDSNTFIVDGVNNRVGIGQQSPAYTLDVNGNAFFRNYIITPFQIGTGTATGQQFLVNTGTGTYRTTNGGSDANGNVTFDINAGAASSVTAGNIAYLFNPTNQFVFTAANGTRRIARAAIQISATNNTPGSEAGDLLFLTQTGGTAISEKLRIFGGGNVSIGTSTDTGYRLNVSGSGRYTNGVTVTGSLSAPSITGSLEGTASWANNAITASYALHTPDSRPYKVFTALLTQVGSSDTGDIEGGALTVGRTYEIHNYYDEMDFTNVGAPNNNIGTFFVATGTTPNSWGIDPQGETLLFNLGAPKAIILENTIGNIWFTYGTIGNHTITSNHLFTSGKVYNSFTNNNFDDVQTSTAVVSIRATSTSTILIQSGIGGEFSNGLIINMPIEIRVYN